MSVNDYERFPLSWMPSKDSLCWPQYLSLAAALEHDIEAGILAPGTMLPAQRLLADYLDINFTTVTRAYALCREKGLIYGVTGRGTFVSPSGEHECVDDHIIEMGVVLGFPSVTKHVVEAAQDVMTRDYLSRLFSYNERSGLARHRSAGVQWMSRFGVRTDAEHTAVFAGAQNAIAVALLSLFRVGDSIATDAYTYANMIGAARLAHIRLVPVAHDEGGMLPEALRSVCKTKRVRGLFVMPYCANPTTYTLSEMRRDALAQVCAEHQLTVIEDDSRQFVSPDCRTLFERLPNQTLYLAGATRLMAAGLRITFAAFPEQFRRALTQGFYHTNIKASALDAEIISQLILTGKASKILEEKRTLALQANALFDDIFPGAPKPQEPGALFRMLPIVSHEESGQAMESRLLRDGIRVCHAYRFCVDKNAGASFLRVSLSSTQNLSKLEEGLRILNKLLNK